MDQAKIELVQGSWKKVAAIGSSAATLFYENLFAADPALKPLFKGNMDEQGKKLLQMIGAAVGKLNDIDTLVPILQNLGQRHTGYGVKVADYHTVGGALLKTLEQGLGEGFTPATRNAWTEVYGMMTQVMTAPPRGAADSRAN